MSKKIKKVEQGISKYVESKEEDEDGRMEERTGARFVMVARSGCPGPF